MPHILLQKLVSGEISLDSFTKWLLSQEEHPELKCSQAVFLTYFLNFVHEEIPCQSKFVDSSAKCGFLKVKHTEEKEEKIKESRDTISDISQNRTLDKSFPGVTHEVNTSTPKYLKVQPNINLNTSYYSPVSPLYETQNNLTSPQDRNQTFVQKSSSLCLGDFIVSRKSSSKKKSADKNCRRKTPEESSRRITPTCLTQVVASERFRKSSNSFDNFNTKEISVENMNGSRSFLAEERLKILRKCSGDVSSIAATKKLATINQGQEVEPEPCLVTCRTAIDRVVGIYTTILKNYLVLNVTSEIYFLISLLLSKMYHSKSLDDSLGVDFLSNGNENWTFDKQNQNCSNFFESIHNIVYFAVNSLESQVEVLKTYDKSTLKLLSLNTRLQTFSRKFSEKLEKISVTKSDRTIEFYDDYSQTNVCFNSDTDNRENFPNDVCFQSFRKQRDLFYEIIRIWETGHVSPGWNFSMSLGGKIKALFVLQGDAANFMHFSRLFKAQLMSTCGKSQREEGFSEDQLPFLSSFPNIDTNKLNLLKNRLVTKQVSSGMNSLTLFMGHQEFYKDFILSAANHVFNRHLCDTFISEIIELNDTKFSCSDLNESDEAAINSKSVAVPPVKNLKKHSQTANTPGRVNQTKFEICWRVTTKYSEVDTLTIKSFALTLRHLRVLAKFLGFIESLPYKSEIKVSEKLLNTHIKLRSQITPSFDIKHLLLRSITENNVVLTIPWLVNYLAMLDYVTLRLPYYILVYRTLFELYRSYEQPTSRRSHCYNTSLVKFSLGWLFELPHFPDTEYFNFLAGGEVCYTRKSNTLDDCNIVDQNVLYICCPYLEEVKKLLTSNSLHSASTVRHITPVSSRESSDVLLKKRSEHLLEEAFFNGQPTSVRKTVEFVSERVASACVKHICHSIVPAFKQSSLREVKLFLESWKKDNQELSPAREMAQKATLKANVTGIAQTSLSALHKQCYKEVSTILSEKLPAAIDGLLSIDSLAQTKSACVSIAARICKERVKQWLGVHVTISIFTKNFDSELQKTLNHENKKSAKDKPVFGLPSGGTKEEHNDGSLSGFHLLEKIKNMSVDIIDDPMSVEDAAVLKLLNEAHVTLRERCDVNEIITKSICTSLVDLSLLLVIHKDFIFTEDIVRLYMKSWECYRGTTDGLFDNLLCPRNVMFMNQSRDTRLVWKSFSKFVVSLIEHKVLSCDNFEYQCTSFFNKHWDRDTLENICYFCRCFVDCYKENGGDASQFVLLMQFFADFCPDL